MQYIQILERPLFTFLFLFSLYGPSALALPEGPSAFCMTYPDAPDCAGTQVTCAQCHIVPPVFNAYGEDVVGALYAIDGYGSEAFKAFLPEALASIEEKDSDDDGLMNLDEIYTGTHPGDVEDFWLEPAPPEGATNIYYGIGEYDHALAYRRVMLTYCGRPPTFDEITIFEAEEEQDVALADALRGCLETDYWLDDALLRLADKRIKPLEAIGFNGLIPLADYEWDYRLFQHILSGDRDARDLFRADYHIDSDGDKISGNIRYENDSVYPPSAPLPVGGQPLDPDKRAGMITTQWFLMSQTMFSKLPRTTAAQAYRSYLGQDIARNEGLIPVADEPLDVDNAGVKAPECAMCHSTLDPLSYAFASYDGIGGGTEVYDGYGDLISSLETTGMYLPERNPWGEDSVILGEPVSNLVEWADVAADSEMFARNLTMMFWKQAIQREPLPNEIEEFDALWKGLEEDEYQVNRLLQRLIQTHAFGAP